MSGDDVQQRASVEIPLGTVWAVTRSGEDDTEFSVERAAKAYAASSGGKVQPRPKKIVFLAPTDGQMLVLTRVMRMLENGRPGEAILAFGDVMDAMMPDADQRQWVYAALTDGRIGLSEFASATGDILDHFGRPAGDAGTATPRKRARAAVRRPR